MSHFGDFSENHSKGSSVLSNLMPSSVRNKFNSRHNHLSTSSNNSVTSLNELLKKPSDNNTKNSKGPVINLKDLIETYAYQLFKENERDYIKAIGKQCSWKDLHKEIDWSSFYLKHNEVKWADQDKPGQLKSSVLFKSTFLNDTEKEQDYQLNAERKTISTCQFELFEGFINEGQIDLSLNIPIPGCALEAGAGFRHEYAMETTRTKSIQEEMNWSVQSNIKIPGRSKTTAELLVQENEYKGRFEIKTYFKGEISMRLFREGCEVLLIELGDLEDILTREKGFQNDSKGLFRMTRGQCKARFGIDQKIELHQQKI